MLSLGPRAWLRLALACSLAPLGIGIVIFVLWLPTHWDFLAMGGLLNVLFGTCLFPIGLGAAGWYFRAAAEDPERRRRTAFAVAMLVLNFSTALSIMATASRLGSTCVVELENASSRSIDRFIVGHRLSTQSGIDILPGARRTFRFPAPSDEGVVFSITQGTRSVEGHLQVHVATSFGGDWRVTLLPGDRVRVEDLRRPLSR